MSTSLICVAPVRERGLKFQTILSYIPGGCRSRKGAWIEILRSVCRLSTRPCRSRKGAWIEINKQPIYDDVSAVAPVRERGLKSISSTRYGAMVIGRSRKGAWIEMMATK